MVKIMRRRRSDTKSFRELEMFPAGLASFLLLFLFYASAGDKVCCSRLFFDKACCHVIGENYREERYEVLPFLDFFVDSMDALLYYLISTMVHD